MQVANGITHYLDDGMEQLIVRALEFFVDRADGTSLATDAEIEQARVYATALTNDTWLCETTEPPQ